MFRAYKFCRFQYARENGKLCKWVKLTFRQFQMIEPGWQSAFEIMKENYSLTDDSIGVFAMSMRFNFDDIRALAAEAITGGGDDKKCDVVFVDKENGIAVVAQCYVSARKRNSAPSNKAADLNTAISWLLSRDLDALPQGLQGRADELRTAITAREIKQIYIWYVHNAPGSANVKTELRTVENTARAVLANYAAAQEINIFSEEIDEKELDRLYNQAERTVIVTDNLEVDVHDAIEIIENDWHAIVTTVKGSWLRDLYIKHRTNLFSANLRGYLGSRESDSNINNGIKTTAETEPQNFYIYNNGVTALVLDYQISKRSKKGRTLKLKGLSIVNGAQTTGSLGSLNEIPSCDLEIPIRFVKASKDSLVAKLVRNNNLQNKLQAADFRSTDGIQERLRNEFQEIPEAEYEGGRRGGASDAIRRSSFTLPSYTVGQALAAFHGDPVAAYDKKSDLWINEKSYRRIFTDRTTARHIVFCYSLLSSINDRKLDLLQKQKLDPSSLTTIEKRNLDFLTNKGANYLLVHVISQCIEIILGRAIPNRFDLHFKENVRPAIATALWSPIVDVILSLSAQLEDAFSRNRISNESMSKAVPKFVGVVDSLRTLQKETFDKFAKHLKEGL